MNISHEPERILVNGQPYLRFHQNIILSADLRKLLSISTFKPKYATLHWTAGSYNTLHKDYHFLIDQQYVYVSETINSRFHYHCYKANSGNFGIGICGMAGATTEYMGKYPITQNQIEATAKIVSILIKKFNIEFYDHAYFAELNGYANQRWDCQYKYKTDDAMLGLIASSEVGKSIFEVVNQKAKWYLNRYF